MNHSTQGFHARLLQGTPLIGTLITLPTSSTAELLADIGYDWLFIDAEHSPLSLREIQGILQAVGSRCPCLVRVPANDEVHIKQVLDLGASGIIAPLVNDADAARSVVSAAKYPPLGTRSVGIARAHGYGRSFGQYLASANENTTVVVQIEHADAAINIDEILEVPGIDAVFLGPYDLSGSVGKPGIIDAPEVARLIEKVRGACAARKVPLGIFAMAAVGAKRFVNESYTLIAVGTDAIILADAAERQLAELK